MNAYELALYLQVESSQAEYGYVVDDWKLLDDSAKMLRQQADELEAFKLNFYNTGYTLQLRDKDETIRQQADRIAELSKNVDELEEELLKAPQIKELSDEEIYKLAEYHGLNDWLYETSVPDFARAILKKASEK